MKEGVKRYVKVMKSLFTAFCVIAVPALMVFLVLAFNRVEGMLFIWLSAALAILFFVVYGFYAMNVTMGTVIEVQYTNKMLYLKTPRKTYTYDMESGCVDMKVYKNKFVGTFETQDSRDKFIFYRRVLFSKYHEVQFTEDDIRPFYPLIDRAVLSAE